MKLYILFFLTCWPILVQADIHKWVDKNGRVHYSDKPISKAGKSKVTIIKPPSQPSGSTAAIQKIEILKARQKTQKTMQDAKNADENQRRELKDMETRDKCMQARIALKELSFKGRLYRRKKSGEREWIGDSERDAKQADAEKFYNNNCR